MHQYSDEAVPKLLFRDKVLYFMEKHAVSPCEEWLHVNSE